MNIEFLGELGDLFPARWDNFQQMRVKVFNRADEPCKNYLSSNRRGFYKIVFINEGRGVFTLGQHTYYIDEPTILFIHPNEIITWKNLAIHEKATGHFCLFKKEFVAEHAALRSFMEKYDLFGDATRAVIKLPAAAVPAIDVLFMSMHAEQQSGGALADDALQAYMQLIMVTANKVPQYLSPAATSDEYNHVYRFFQILERETAGINDTTPVRIKTAQEFAEELGVHPSHLSMLLKKYTGQTLGVHIKNRLLEASKILLLQTDWTLQRIGYAVGYMDQPNFSSFFKRNTGMTPAEFRKEKL